jgi:hypothetical protein
MKYFYNKLYIKNQIKIESKKILLFCPVLFINKINYKNLQKCKSPLFDDKCRWTEIYRHMYFRKSKQIMRKVLQAMRNYFANRWKIIRITFYSLFYNSHMSRDYAVDTIIQARRKPVPYFINIVRFFFLYSHFHVFFCIDVEVKIENLNILASWKTP